MVIKPFIDAFDIHLVFKFLPVIIYLYEYAPPSAPRIRSPLEDYCRLSNIMINSVQIRSPSKASFYISSARNEYTIVTVSLYALVLVSYSHRLIGRADVPVRVFCETVFLNFIL